MTNACAPSQITQCFVAAMKPLDFMWLWKHRETDCSRTSQKNVVKFKNSGKLLTSFSFSLVLLVSGAWKFSFLFFSVPCFGGLEILRIALKTEHPLSQL